MMNDNDLENWVYEQGGPAIQLRMYMRQSENKSKKDVENSVSKLLNIEEVNTILNYLDGFKIQSRDKKTLEHLIHYYKETCIDNFFPQLLDMGFRAGIPILDEKMQPVRDVFMYLLTEDYDYCYYYGLMLHRFFFMAGYTHQEIIESMEQRLNAIHKSAYKRIFDIYQDESKLPKKPKQWADIGVLKDDLNPFSRFAKEPLPTIYDISALAYFPDTCKNSENQAKIDDIIEYILDPEFQKIREGYGLLWVESRRIYHACGWSPTLPLYEDYNGPQNLSVNSVLNYLYMMSNFRAAHKSKWFKNCINYVEQFRTEKGTYIFPKEYLYRKYIDKAFLNESAMKLKRTEREIIIRELVSTLIMVEINKRVAEFTS